MAKRLPKTPWPAQVIRDQTKRAIDSVGGSAGFDAIGPTFREAIITQAAFRLFQTAASVNPITVSNTDMAVTVRAMRIAAGMEK